MKSNWMKQGLLIAALGVLPMANAWSQTPPEPVEAEQREGETGERVRPRENAENERRFEHRRRGGRPPMRERDERGEKAIPEHHRRDGRRGERGGQYRDDQKWDGHKRGEGKRGERRGDSRRRGGDFENRRGPRRGGRDGAGRERRWSTPRGGRFDSRRDGGRYRMGNPARNDWRDHDRREDDERRYNARDRMTLRGTVTAVVADNSIGLRARDGNSFWVQLPESHTARLRVGQEVELSGEWKNQSFVARSVRLR